PLACRLATSLPEIGAGAEGGRTGEVLEANPGPSAGWKRTARQRLLKWAAACKKFSPMFRKCSPRGLVLNTGFTASVARLAYRACRALLVTSRSSRRPRRART